MPPRSRREARSREPQRAVKRPVGLHPGERATNAISANGTLTKKTDRQPSAPTRTPPTGSPRDAVAIPAICRPPSTPPGGLPSPASRARWRISSIAVGYAQEVPRPISTRLASSVSRSCANPPASPPTPTRMIPARKTRRGPSTSAALPAVGCAIAVARYSAVTSAAVCPTGTPIPCAIGSRAVAISELLTGLRAEPMIQRGSELPRERAAPRWRGVAGRAGRTRLWWGRHGGSRYLLARAALTADRRGARSGAPRPRGSRSPRR